MVKNAADPKRFKFIGYTGDAVDLSDYNFDAPVVYDLETLKVAGDNIPFNYNHRVKIGQTDTIKNTKQVIRGTATITEKNKIAQRVENSAEAYEASMGLDVEKAEVIYYSQGMTANGQEFVGPHYLIKNSLLDEMTVTEKGRDSMTKVHKLSRTDLTRIKNSSPDRKPKKRVKNRNSAPTAPAPAPQKKRVRNAAPAISYIKLRRLENRYPEYQDMILKMAERNVPYERILNKVRLSAAEDRLQQPPNLGGEKVDLLEARLVNTLCKDPEKTLKEHYGEETRDRVMNMDHLGLKEIMVIGANRLGGNFTGFSDLDQLIDFVGRANTGRLENTGFSTFSMPNLFKRATEIVMEESWKVQDFFAPGACYATSHSDFKLQERYRPSGGAMWEGLDKNGRVKHGSFGKETRYTAKLDTKAQMLGFNREDIENDDMGVIQEMLSLMVEGALIVPDYKLVQHMLAAAGNGFWSATDTDTLKKNHYTGTALTPTNLSTVYLAAQKQTINKGRVNWVNQITDQWDLVIPPELEETAWNIIKQDKIISPVDTSTVRGDKNYWFGKLGIKKFNQLSNTSMHSGANATRWFLWPKSTKYAPFAISYLKGRRRPVIKVREAPVDMLGFVVVGVFDVEINDREQSAIIRCES